MTAMSAGDVRYDTIGHGYSAYRRADPRIAAAVLEALGDARTVVNVGAGTGSYEPTDRPVTPVEPSTAMDLQRDPALLPAVLGVAESLPFADGTADAAMAVMTMHHWADVGRGLAEMAAGLMPHRQRAELPQNCDSPALPFPVENHGQSIRAHER